MDLPGEMDEKLRESCCVGDSDAVSLLIAQGASVNSQNKMNGWTALHWAVKRNHRSIINILLDNKADPKVMNFKGEKPIDFAVDEAVIASLLENSVPPLSQVQSRELTQPCETVDRKDLGFVPNYLAHPAFPYVGHGDLKAENFKGSHGKGFEVQSIHTVFKPTSIPPGDFCAQLGGDSLNRFTTRSTDGFSNANIHHRTHVVRSPVEMSQALFQGDAEPRWPVVRNDVELVLKVRKGHGMDPDFIEIELDLLKLTYENLLLTCCKELEIPCESVTKIRKLPNTVVRKDKDVARLRMFEELEVVCNGTG